MDGRAVNNNAIVLNGQYLGSHLSLSPAHLYQQPYQNIQPVLSHKVILMIPQHE